MPMPGSPCATSHVCSMNLRRFSGRAVAGASQTTRSIQYGHRVFDPPGGIAKKLWPSTLHRKGMQPSVVVTT
eukprot:7294395-Prymnesium_polylepis.2